MCMLSVNEVFWILRWFGYLVVVRFELNLFCGYWLCFFCCFEYVGICCNI